MDEQRRQQAELIAAEVEANLLSMNEIKNKIADIANKRKTFGKSMEEWFQILNVKIDPSADPAKVKYYAAQIANNLSVAYDNLARIKVMYAQYKLSYLPALSQKVTYQTNHRGRKVPPALETMIKVSENELGDRSLLPVEFEAYIDFWQDMVYKLKDTANQLKTITVSNGTLYRVGEF